jgi:hypothetical protein
MHTTAAGVQIKALKKLTRQRIKEANIARKVALVVPEAKDTVERMDAMPQMPWPRLKISRLDNINSYFLNILFIMYIGTLYSQNSYRNLDI